MFKWKKIGRVFNPQDVKDISWMKEFSQAPSVLVFDGFIRVYFSCRQPADANGQYISRLAYVDFDRSDLTKAVNISKNPILALGGLGSFDEFGTNPASVIRDGDDIRIYYAGWTRCESVPFNAAIGVALSHDNGETFKKLGTGPVLSYSPYEPFTIGSPKVRKFGGRWHLWYVSGKKWIKEEGRPEPVYKIRTAVSSDGINWEKADRDLIESKLDENECQASPDVFYSKGKYHMFFSYRHSLGYKSKEKGYRIGYACSDDLTNWIRDDAKAGIDVSANGWDSEMVSYPHVFELDGSIYMLYQGNGVGKTGFGLAKLEGQLD